MLENILRILTNLFTWNNVLFINIGLSIGIIIGAMPGLTATMGVALLLPLTFGMNPAGGVNLIPALIGFFAISEILNKVALVDLDYQIIEKEIRDDKKLSFEEIRKYLKTIIKSSAIGTFIGAIPGTGAAIASFLSYNEAKRVSKNS